MPDTVSHSHSLQARLDRSILIHPLDEFYRRVGRVLPSIEEIEAPKVPEPYQALLVHEKDMTPTLEHYYGRKIHLSVLSSHQENGFYFREVVLLLDETNQPVEFGAIKMDLNLFSASARAEVLQEKRPLGTILTEQRMVHSSRPKAFLRVASDPVMEQALKLSAGHDPYLYGRRNTLWTPDRKPLAEIVEILPIVTRL